MRCWRVFQATPVPATGKQPIMPNTTTTLELAACARLLFFSTAPKAPLGRGTPALSEDRLIAAIHRLLNKTGEHPSGIEIFRGDLTRGLGMPLIVRFDLPDGNHRILQSTEGEE